MLEGRLEICLNGRWGTVGSEGWSQVNSEIVCNDLGYEPDMGISSLLEMDYYIYNCS